MTQRALPSSGASAGGGAAGGHTAAESSGHDAGRADPDPVLALLCGPRSVGANAAALVVVALAAGQRWRRPGLLPRDFQARTAEAIYEHGTQPVGPALFCTTEEVPAGAGQSRAR